MPERSAPIRETSPEARALARNLIQGARFAALAVTDPGTGAPFVSRIAMGTAPDGCPISLVSGLALHTNALRADPRCALLLGEPDAKGDPLIHPRLSLSARAEFVARASADHAALRSHWLASHPKSTLYVDFPDFAFVRFTPLGAALNGGFAQAYRLTAADLA